MNTYKIQTEGRNIKEVVKVGRTFRMDVQGSLKGVKIKELKGLVYRTQLGHTLADGTKVMFVTVLRVNEEAKEKKAATIPANKKRYVLKNCYQLGIDAEYQDENGKYYPTWYIIDKTNNEIMEADWGNGARTNLKRFADSMNKNELGL